jgi:hypothetical protein
LCDAQGCKVIDGPRILYFDPGHLSEYGGQFLADHASAELRKLLAPQIGGEQKRPVRAAIPAQASR